MCAIGAVGLLPMQSLHGDQLVIISTIENHQPMTDKANAKGCSKIQNAEALVNISKIHINIRYFVIDTNFLGILRSITI